MKSRWFLALVLGWATSVLAHDEGHGPKLTDSAKQGGVVAPVVEAKDAKLGSKAKLVYKAELVRSEDGTVRVYLYDDKMNALKLDGFDKNATALLQARKAKKASFELKLDGDAFVGKAPKPARKPFSIDVTLREKTLSLLAAFDNLD